MVKEDTYELTDKRYFGSFTDTESLSWGMVAEVYRRSGGNLDGVETLTRGDGAPWISGFQKEHLPFGRYILDHHHLCEKVKERLSSVISDREKRNVEQEAIMGYLNSDDVDGSLEHIWSI